MLQAPPKLQPPKGRDAVSTHIPPLPFPGRQHQGESTAEPGGTGLRIPLDRRPVSSHGSDSDRPGHHIINWGARRARPGRVSG